MRKLCWMLMAAVLVCQAGEKKRPPITNEAGNDNIDITADPLLLPDEIRAALGDSLPTGIIAVKVKLVPKGESAINISPDDFILLSHKDGQRSGAYYPSQIAGSATMVVKTQQVGGGGIGSRSSGPVFSGGGGTIGRGRPMQGPADGGGIGNSGSNESKTSAEIKDDPKTQNPLLKTLGEKILPSKESADPVSGLLYFPLDGKVKTKDLELIYQGPAGRLYINFR